MITSIEQATTVQQRRVAKGKEGHSKAVRTFLKRNLNLTNLDDYNAYLMLKSSLPSLPITCKAKDEPESTEEKLSAQLQDTEA